MRHISCDLCTKDLIAGTDARYTITLDTRLMSDPTPWPHDPNAEELELDTDHIDAMASLLADLPNSDDDTVDDLDELMSPVAPLNRSFDLCERCYRRFAADPLGRAPRRHLSFSPN